MFALAGQLEKMDKDEETVAMPTARNQSPEDGEASVRNNDGGRSSRVKMSTGQRSQRNNQGGLN